MFIVLVRTGMGIKELEPAEDYDVEERLEK